MADDTKQTIAISAATTIIGLALFGTVTSCTMKEQEYKKVRESAMATRAQHCVNSGASFVDGACVFSRKVEGR